MEQGGALEQVGARIERVMGLTAKVSGPQNAGPLDRRVRPEGQKGTPCLEEGRSPRKSAGPRKRRSTARMIAGGSCCTSAGGQKGLNLPKRTQAKPRRAPKPPRRNLGERRSAGVNGGLHDAECEGTNALSSAAAVGGRLRRTVRPEGQKGAP